jgi:pimeloyl-ACP methyl ester carboxylesterase
VGSSLRKVVRSRVRDAVDTVAHGYDYTRHLVRGNRIRGDLARLREGAPPVVLVHGFLGTRGTMIPLTRRLQGDGRAVFSYAYGTFQLGSIRRSAETFVADLRKIVDELEVEHVDLIGYSMGGLIGLHAIKFLQAHLWVRRFVMLGSPVAGTWVGLAGVATMGAMSPSVWQVLPGSKFLRELVEAPLPDGVEVRQIQASSDNFVPRSEPIEGVRPRDFVVMPGGHSSLVVAPHFYEAVREFIDVRSGHADLRRPSLNPEPAL